MAFLQTTFGGARSLSKSYSIRSFSRQRMRYMATIVPPVTQNNAGSKGPTAMVFMNMGGPATTDQVGDFLSRLFVRRIDTPCTSSRD